MGFRKQKKRIKKKIDNKNSTDFFRSMSYSLVQVYEILGMEDENHFKRGFNKMRHDPYYKEENKD